MEAIRDHVESKHSIESATTTSLSDGATSDDTPAAELTPSTDLGQLGQGIFQATQKLMSAASDAAEAADLSQGVETIKGLFGKQAADGLRPVEIAAQVAPSSSVRVFLSRVAAAPDPWRFLLHQAKAGVLMTSSLASRPPLAASIMPYSPAILPHLPSIYTRLTILRPHVPGIARILDPYFDVVEPHLDRIMERMDQIEPHLPYLLLHLDVLAPHCGPLLDHFDELMPYASSKDEIARGLEGWTECYMEQSGSDIDVDTFAACVVESWDDVLPEAEIKMRYQETSYLPRLLPYVDFLVEHIDDLAPHLHLVHRHLPHILPYMEDLLPYIPLFASYPKASANADVLVGYLGWMLRVPVVPRILYIPNVAKFIAELSTLLPRKLIRPVLQRRRRRWEEAERALLQVPS